jgi:hypothetical protein
MASAAGRDEAPVVTSPKAAAERRREIAKD